jgi:ribulose-phosphate 3-epimerase
MVEVLPAIIPQSFEDLQDKMSQVKGLTKLVQIDICDGKFVPSKCWPYIGDSEGDFERIITESEGFPFWEDMDFEVDMMVKNPEEVVEKWIHAGAKAIILHIESSPKILELVKKIRKDFGYANDTVAGVEIGIALNIDTPNTVLDEFLKNEKGVQPLIDFVQFMGIDKIGFQGQEFDNKVLKKISDLRKKYKKLLISVDGGVNFDTYKDIEKAGANKLISGSAIYESDNIREAIEEMKGN